MTGMLPNENTDWDIFNTQDTLLETLSVMQHHDAITGTHMKRVGRDYIKMLSDAYKSALDFETSP